MRHRAPCLSFFKGDACLTSRLTVQMASVLTPVCQSGRFYWGCYHNHASEQRGGRCRNHAHCPINLLCLQLVMFFLLHFSLFVCAPGESFHASRGMSVEVGQLGGAVSSPLQQESNLDLWALQQSSLLTEPSHPLTICFFKSWIFLTGATESKRRKESTVF